MTRSAARLFLLAVLGDPDFDGDPGPEWPAVLDAARAEAIVTLLYTWLRGGDDRARRAGPWLETLRRERVALAARGLALSAELARLLPAFRDVGLSCVPLRGPALAEWLYGEATSRPIGDLDLLVRRPDLSRVRELLVARGYCEVDRRRGFAEAYSYTLEFYRPTEPALVVEPHWTIAYPPAASRLDMDRVWSRCVRTSVLGVDALALGPEDRLLNLCLHLTHAAPEAPLLWHWEIDRAIRREGPRLDWTAFIETAREARVQASVGDALGRVRELFGTPLPAGVADALARPAAGLAQRVAATAADGRESLALFFDLGGVRNKLRYALALLFPSPDFMRLQHGPGGGLRLGMAYMRRLCRFAFEAGRVLFLLCRAWPRRADSRG